MFHQLAQSYTKPFTPFTLYPTIDHRSLWTRLNPTLTHAIHENALQYLHYSYPPLPADLYMQFYQNGNRVDYETNYFKRRHALNALVIAECALNNGIYMSDIVNGIFALCEETAWQLPAHNTYIRDMPSHLLADITKPILDLFACETGALLATIDYLLGPKLDAISPLIRTRIAFELERRIITPYLNKHFWWMGRDGEPMNNWTIWCTQNILLTFFLTSNSFELRHKAFLKASKSIDYFLKEYGDDGCCDEGAQYYRHAGLCLFNSIEILNAVTENFFKDVYHSDKVRHIAAYIYHVHVSGDYYINFADCAAVPGPSGVREFLFAQRTHNPAMIQYAIDDFLETKDKLMTSEINLYYRIQNIFSYDAITTFPRIVPPAKPDIFYESVGLAIARDDHFCLAVKAGNNDDSHNHNDTGSFTVYKDGHPLLVDIGVESYTAKTFSNKRYDIWTMQSDYHNLPTIHGIMQCPGPGYQATHVETDFSNDQFSILMELTHSYPKEAHLTHYSRQIHLQKNDFIRITDRMGFTHTTTNSIVSNIITYEKPIIDGHTISLAQLGKIELEGDIQRIDIEVLPITDPRLQLSWDHDLYRIRIYYNGPQLVMMVI